MDENPIKWKVHTPNLLKEIAGNSGQTVLLQPLRILGDLLSQVGRRASEIDDPELNALMCRLTIYSIANPGSDDYDPAAVQQILKGGKA